ncbi:LegC family aminotransferase [Candidatus Berkiella aquae]|uniref:GDP-perosamine synthase n=1 Tax=Candidatus Berkiella aquae TaxID=295108 RepID=A0A0Q9YNU0_9GAMM|nr:LegC family aminotransferase [Candidatus Berkiella aquae]MCS5712337.1 LegC family aminotransferase [Candidatus Berkiella aquae]
MVNIEQCLAALTQVLGENDKDVPLHEPKFNGNEWQYVKDCLDSGWVSSVGEYVTLFEQKIADYTGMPYAIAVMNGTAALHVCLLLADVAREDEVLIPSLTFVATANAVTYCGAHPHFIECHESHLGIDLDKLRTYLTQIAIVKDKQCINKLTGRRIKAIIPVHIFGHPIEMSLLQTLAQEFHLKIIEDASESLGSFYRGVHTGHASDIACLSFNGNKVVTTGGGGAILIKDEALAKKAKHMTTTAKRPHRYEFYHDEIGYNYRLPNINAALGCAQLERLPQMIENKRHLAKRYQDVFSDIQGASILQEPQYAKSNYWLNALILDKPDRSFIEHFIDSAVERKYHLRGLWTPMDRLPMYQSSPKMDLTMTHQLFDRVISLPSSPHLGGVYA